MSLLAQSRHGATSDLSPLCNKERKPLVRIGAAKALAQFGGVTPAVGKTPRQTAPSPQRSSVVAHFSDARAMLPLASRARPTARPVRATYRFAGIRLCSLEIHQLHLAATFQIITHGTPLPTFCGR